MKSLYLSLLISLTTVGLKGQELTIKQENSDEITFAFGISKIHEFGSNYVYIKLLEYDLVGGLVELEGQDLIVKNFYIYIKQRTEDTPTTENYYSISAGFYNPRDLQFNTDSRILTFTHGTETNPKTVKLLISTDEIKKL